jgi:uncharacterized repeat protein (TIGR03806 family)
VRFLLLASLLFVPPPYGLDSRAPIGPYLDGRVSSLPPLLSQTGAFADVATLSPIAALLPFDLNAALWSDGAVKRRWVAVPTPAQVGFAPTGEWTFPEGTVFVKHFELPVDDTNPAIRKRLETRLLLRVASGGVYGVAYKWRADESDADLLPDGGPDAGRSEDVVIQTAGGTRIQKWYYPSRADCLRCHNANANFVLGPKTRQLNRKMVYPSTGIEDNQLRTWNHLGLFTPAIQESDIRGFTRMASLGNTSASLQDRVRSYIDANCASCHRPGFSVHGSFDARYDTPFAEQGILNGGVFNSVGIPNGKVVVPGDPSSSVLYARISVVGAPVQMPPVARNTVDTAAVAATDDWIRSLGSDGGGGGGGCGLLGGEAVLLVLWAVILRRRAPS